MSTSDNSSTDDAHEESAEKASKKASKKKAAPASPDEATTEKNTDKASRRRRRGARPQAVPGLNPTWWAPVMCTLMVVGLLWIVAFYLLSNGPDNTWPIPGIGYGNLAIGFGLIMAGFLMTTRWK